jgi:MFS family permease
VKSITKSQEILFLALVSLFWFAQYVYMPHQTTYLTAYGIAGNLIGVIIGAYGVSQLMFRLPLGVMADTVGKHKLFILIGALSSGIASLIRVISPGEMGFLTGNLLSGFASAMWISFMVFYSNCYSEEEQHTANSRIILYNNLGILLGFVTSALLYDKIGMRNTCVLSLTAGFLAFCLGCFIKESKSVHNSPSVRELLKVCFNKQIWVFAILALIQQGIQLSTTMSFTTQILKNLGASGTVIGAASIVYMISSVSFAGFANSNFCKRRGAKFFIPFVLIIVALYCILVPSVNSIAIIFVLQVLPGMSTGILFSFTVSEAMKGVPKEKKSSAMGFFQAFYALGMTFLPILTGTVATAFTIRAAYFVLAGIAITGCILALFYYRKAYNKRV